MAEEIGFENGRNSNFQVLVTLTLTLITFTCIHRDQILCPRFHSDKYIRRNGKIICNHQGLVLLMLYY